MFQWIPDEIFHEELFHSVAYRSAIPLFLFFFLLLGYGLIDKEREIEQRHHNYGQLEAEGAVAAQAGVEEYWRH